MICMTLTRVQPNTLTSATEKRDVSAHRIRNAGSIKGIWKAPHTRALWYKIRYTLARVSMLAMMLSNSYLAVFREKPIYFTIKQPMESWV